MYNKKTINIGEYMNYRIIVIITVFLAFLSCQAPGGLKVYKTFTDDTIGFINVDTLQAIGVAFSSFSQKNGTKRKIESEKAAVIMARMEVIEFLISTIKDEGQEKFYALMKKIGQFSKTRYDPVYSSALIKGGYRVDAMFEILGIRGYAHKKKYFSTTGKTWVCYRIVKAGLLQKVKSAFIE